MPFTVTFTAKVPTDWDPDAPLTSAKLNDLYDNTEYLAQWLGGSYRANAAPDHVHDGVGSAPLNIGANYLRNGSFETDTSGWTITQYTGGTVVRDTANPLDGQACLAFTSTVLANGGGDAVSNEYVPCSGGQGYYLDAAIKASVAGVSAKIETIWYDAAKNQISTSVVYTSSSVPTALTNVGGLVAAPATARFRRTKITGGVPAAGTAVGTVYFDGLLKGVGAGYSASSGSLASGGPTRTGTTTTTNSNIAQLRAPRGGKYTASWSLTSNGSWTYGQIYVNGIAVGVAQSTLSTTPVPYTDDVTVAAGDLVQLFGYSAGAGSTGTLALNEAQPLLPA